MLLDPPRIQNSEETRNLQTKPCMRPIRDEVQRDQSDGMHGPCIRGNYTGRGAGSVRRKPWGGHKPPGQHKVEKRGYDPNQRTPWKDKHDLIKRPSNNRALPETYTSRTNKRRRSKTCMMIQRRSAMNSKRENSPDKIMQKLPQVFGITLPSQCALTPKKNTYQ